jgi:hypothetical protein
MQKAELVQDTPVRLLSAIVGLGLDINDQTVPFQDSTRVCPTNDASS